MSFSEKELAPNEEITYVVVVGITDEDDSVEISNQYNSSEKFCFLDTQSNTAWSMLSPFVKKCI